MVAVEGGGGHTFTTEYRPLTPLALFLGHKPIFFFGGASITKVQSHMQAIHVLKPQNTKGQGCK